MVENTIYQPLKLVPKKLSIPTDQSEGSTKLILLSMLDVVSAEARAEALTRTPLDEKGNWSVWYYREIIRQLIDETNVQAVEVFHSLLDLAGKSFSLEKFFQIYEKVGCLLMALEMGEVSLPSVSEKPQLQQQLLEALDHTQNWYRRELLTTLILNRKFDVAEKVLELMNSAKGDFKVEDFLDALTFVIKMASPDWNPEMGQMAVWLAA